MLPICIRHSVPTGRCADVRGWVPAGLAMPASLSQAARMPKQPCKDDWSRACPLQEHELAPYRAATRARKESKDSFRAEFGDLEFRSERELDDAIKAGLFCPTWQCSPVQF